MDNLDKKILELLCKDSKLNFKAIGEKIHMTGQAVGVRVRRLEDEGIIEGYTTKLNTKKLGLVSAYITLFLKEENHTKLRNYVQAKKEIVETSRISGEGCYMIKVEVEDLDAMNVLCDEITSFARYRLNIITEYIKARP